MIQEINTLPSLFLSTFPFILFPGRMEGGEQSLSWVRLSLPLWRGLHRFTERNRGRRGRYWQTHRRNKVAARGHYRTDARHRSGESEVCDPSLSFCPLCIQHPQTTPLSMPRTFSSPSLHTHLHLLHIRRGSGLIAGETSRAYDETFTLSYVTGRSVGIGAYLNR